MIEDGDHTSLWKPAKPTSEQLQAFLQRHLTLLLQERQAELEESHLLLSSVSPKVLERNGLALCRLGVLNTSVGMGGKTLVELHRSTAHNTDSKFPPHTFRSGDVVVIVDEAETSDQKGKKKGTDSSKSSSSANERTDGVVTRVTESKIIVAIGRKKSKRTAEGNADDDDQQLPSRCRLVKVASEVTWERMEKNLVRLARKLNIPVRTSRGIRGGSGDDGIGGGANDGVDSSSDDEQDAKSRPFAVQSKAPLPPPPSSIPSVPRLLCALLALETPSGLPSTLPAPPLPLFNTSLNSSQTQALSRALASRELHLIHGPPGTGKTTVLVELVLQLVIGRGERVLVAGSSNLAVDNLAAKLLDYRKGQERNLRPVRIGHPARILTSVQNHTLDFLSTTSSSGQLLADVRQELAAAYNSLYSSSNKESSAGNKSTSRRGTSSLNNNRVTGSERKKLWEEVRALRGELRKRERGLFTETIEDANVVLSTLHGASGGVLERSLRSDGGQSADEPGQRKKKFDTVIVDEACQALEASTWGAILDKSHDDNDTQGCRLILAGDDKQLGPVVKSESDSEVKRDKKKAKEVEGAKKQGKGMKGKESTAADAQARPSEDTTLSTKAQEQLTVESVTDSAEQLDSDGEENSVNTSEKLGIRQQTTLRPPKTLHTTLFSRLLSLYGPGLKSLLQIQYRMNDKIMEYPNQALYEGKLIAHESNRDSWIGDGSLMGWKGSQEDLEDVKGGRVVFFDTAGSELYEDAPEDDPSKSTLTSSDSKANSHEASLVASHVSLLLSTGIPASSITLLAPYNAQISLMSSTLSTSLSPDDFSALEIGTIDGLQGREKDVVIISLTRSNEQGEVGFLKEYRRLNVAMTRAKKMLVVFGDSETVSKGGKFLQEWMEWLDLNAVVEAVLPI
ncbi:unnamed protein product [Sympodiomycopsis kandeliae]